MPATTTNGINDAATSAQDQIKQLREQVDSLMRERVTPFISEAAGRAEDVARHAQDIAEDQVEKLSGRVRDMPLTSILVAAAAGYLLGRLSR